MNLNDITTQPYILALFKRDDGQRFLLGSGAYEFKESQQHFVANAMVNDVVEVQGSDGALLAGQVRRASVQSFDGYIGDGGVIKSSVEKYRKDFIAYFQKNHLYTVVYIFADGTAIQRKRGYIVDAPEVKELYQMTPEYHLALNFEDVNYYKYAEDSDGDEMYSNYVNVTSATTSSGGLIWDTGGESSITAEGVQFNIYGTIAGTALDSFTLKGQTVQQTYTGKNLFKLGNSYTYSGVTFTNNGDGTFNISGTATSAIEFSTVVPLAQSGIVGGQAYTVSSNEEISTGSVSYFVHSCQSSGTWAKTLLGFTSAGTQTAAEPSTDYVKFVVTVRSGTTLNLTNVRVQVEKGSTATSFEPYTGGVASPNPDYPQTVHTVSGEQTITISDGNSQSQSYTVDLSGKNLFDKDNASILNNYYFDELQLTIAASGSRNGLLYISCMPNTTYSLTVGSLTNLSQIQVGESSETPALGVAVKFIGAVGSNLKLENFTTSSTAKYIILRAQTPTGVSVADRWNDITNGMQLEKGSTATAYEPYNPIELCKIGTYQDYIYKSGNDWYVHKETKKVIFNGSESWSYATEANHERFVLSVPDAALSSYTFDGTITEKSDQFEGVTWRTLYNAQSLGLDNLISGHDSGHYIIVRSTKFTSASAWTTWLNSNNLTVYYALDTATDTQITDAFLITELDGLLQMAECYDGVTTFKNEAQAAGSVPGWMVVEVTTGSGGIIWDNIGATWEEGGEGGDTYVTVDSITNVFPTITINGPAYNPKVTNVTTGQIIQYNGNVNGSQKLIIDIEQKTAKLSGTSVISNISGDWLYLTPGVNRLTYTIDNADKNYATIEWQEITG